MLLVVTLSLITSAMTTSLEIPHGYNIGVVNLLPICNFFNERIPNFVNLTMQIQVDSKNISTVLNICFH